MSFKDPCHFFFAERRSSLLVEFLQNLRKGSEVELSPDRLTKIASTLPQSPESKSAKIEALEALFLSAKKSIKKYTYILIIMPRTS